jgi:hypothetical protein
MSRTTESFGELIDGKPRPRAQTRGPQEGVILEVGDGEAWFSLPEFEPNRRFGPAPYGRTSDPPEVGDRCLIVFIGSGVDRAWVASWAEPAT